MQEDSVQQTPEIKIKKHGSKKKLIILVSFITVIFVGLSVALFYLLPKLPYLLNGDIVIGDTTITKKALSDYEQSIKNFAKQNPASIISSDTKSVAIEDLIMNAALKQNAKKLNKTVTDKEIMEVAFISVSSDKEASDTIDQKLGQKGSFKRVRNENIAYENKLKSDIITTKSIFVTEIMFDTPYFQNLPKDEVQVAYEKAKAKLDTDFLPLFKSKLSKEDIAKKTDVNFLDEDKTDDEDYLQYSKGLVSGAIYYSDYRADGKYFNNISDNNYIRGDIGTVYNIDDKIATLNNVGDYTEVFSSQIGAFVIIRLEAKNNGDYDSWGDMLESYKNKYAYDNTSKIISDVSYGTQSFLNKAAEIAFSIGTEKVYAEDSNCTGHIIHWHYGAYDDAGNFLNGAKLRIWSHYGLDGCTSGNNDPYIKNLETGVDTYTNEGYSCMQSHINYARTADPSGYEYASTKTYSASGGLISSGTNSLITSPSNSNHYDGGSGGFPAWEASAMNSVGEHYVKSFYKSPPVAEKTWTVQSTTTVDKSVITLGETLTWTHNAYNKGKDPTDRVVNYSASGHGASGSRALASGTAKNVYGTEFTTSLTPSATGSYCRTTTASPLNQTGGGSSSSQACASVVNVPPPAAVEWDASVGVWRAASNNILDMDFDFDIYNYLAGETAYWLHGVKNDGPDSLDTGVNYGYKTMINGAEIDSAPLGTLSSGAPSAIFWTTLNIFARKFSISSYSIPVGTPDGTEICRATYASPSSKGVASEVTSAYKCILVEKPEWSVGVRTEVDKLQAYPGETVTFTHKIKNNGPDSTTAGVAYSYNSTTDITGTVKGPGGVAVSASGSLGTLPTGTGKNLTYTFATSSNSPSIVIPATATEDQKYCRTTSATPESSTSSGTITSYEECVNVMEPINWQVNPSTSVKIDKQAGGSDTTSAADTQVLVGDIITWTHKIDVVTPVGAPATATDREISFGFNGDFAPLVDPSPRIVAGGKNVGYSESKTSLFTGTGKILSSNVGKFCRKTYVTPAVDEGTSASSANVCVHLSPDFTLTPTVSLNDNVIDPGTTVTATPKLENGGPTYSVNTNWEFNRLIFIPGQNSTNLGGESPNAPCTGVVRYFNHYSSCTPVGSGTRNFETSPADLTTFFSSYINSYVVPELTPVGTKICYVLSVKPYNASTTDWRHSMIECAKVSKSPKTQIWGGDLRTAGLVQTSTITKSGNLFGSWTEYGILAKGTITKTGSAAAFAPLLGGLSTVTDYSKLSFNNVNTACPSVIGCYYSTEPTIPDVDAKFPDAGASIIPSSPVVPSALPNGVNKISGNLSLSASNLGAGQSIIIKASGTITIEDNQAYLSGPYTNIKQIPQLIIIADKIIIKSTVTYIDAWLIATGSNGVIETCDTGSTTYDIPASPVPATDLRLTTGKCNLQLKINGPVMAEQLWLRRTYGSNPALFGEPAEIVNLRADAYLWSAYQASLNPRIQTVYTTEVSPRF